MVAGVELQISNFVSGFSKYGDYVGVSSEGDVDLSSYDVVHITGLFSGCDKFYDNCISQNRKFYIKSIFHPLQFPNISFKLADYIDKSMGVFCESKIERDNLIQCYYNFRKSTPNVKFYITLPSLNDVFKSVSSRDRKFIHTNGRYNQSKNHDLVISACKELNIPVITAGFVEDKSYFKKCKDIGWGEIFGYKSQDDLKLILEQTKLYVCASSREVCSGSVCEAIACKCLVLSHYSHEGNDNFTEDGYYVYRDNNDLKGHIDYLYNNFDNLSQRNSCWFCDDLVKFYRNIFLKSFLKLI